MWSRTGNVVALILITFFFVVGYFDPNFNITLTKADNFPIVLMVYTMWYFTWLAMHKAYINDGRLEKGLKPEEYNDPDDKVLVWPDLVFIEFIALILLTVFLIVWSILVPAPLEEPANPAATLIHQKHRGIFRPRRCSYILTLGLQVLFFHYLSLGMCAIPYIDVNKNGDGIFI